MMCVILMALTQLWIDMEIWKEVQYYGGHYEASNIGNVRSKDRIITKYSVLCKSVVNQNYKGKVLLKAKTRDGHFTVRIGVDKKKYTIQVGRMVLMAFVGLPNLGEECCHNNGVAGDNRIENLRWDTHFNNNKDRLRHGTYKRGESHHYSKFSNDFLLKVKRKEIGKEVAMANGISNTHYYRILKS
jgi:hypothetical protein